MMKDFGFLALPQSELGQLADSWGLKPLASKPAQAHLHSATRQFRNIEAIMAAIMEKTTAQLYMADWLAILDKQLWPEQLNPALSTLLNNMLARAVGDNATQLILVNLYLQQLDKPDGVLTPHFMSEFQQQYQHLLQDAPYYYLLSLLFEHNYHALVGYCLTNQKAPAEMFNLYRITQHNNFCQNAGDFFSYYFTKELWCDSPKTAAFLALIDCLPVAQQHQFVSKTGSYFKKHTQLNSPALSHWLSEHYGAILGGHKPAFNFLSIDGQYFVKEFAGRHIKTMITTLIKLLSDKENNDKRKKAVDNRERFINALSRHIQRIRLFTHHQDILDSNKQLAKNLCKIKLDINQVIAIDSFIWLELNNKFSILLTFGHAGDPVGFRVYAADNLFMQELASLNTLEHGKVLNSQPLAVIKTSLNWQAAAVNLLIKEYQLPVDKHQDKALLRYLEFKES